MAEVTKDDRASSVSENPILSPEMREVLDDYKRHITALFERTQEKLQMIAAQLADISQRLPPRP